MSHSAPLSSASSALPSNLYSFVPHTRSLASHSSLSPPSLLQDSSHEYLMRSLYSGVHADAHAHSSAEDSYQALEAPVYRSVTMSHGAGGVSGFGKQAMEQQGGFDMEAFGGYAKENGLKQISAQEVMEEYGIGKMDMPTLRIDTRVQPMQLQQQQQPAAMLAVAAVAAAADSDVPPAAPMWLEPNSHFYCSCVPPTNPALLFETVLQTLKTLHEQDDQSSGSASSSPSICTIDCCPTPGRFKICCTAYQSHTGNATPFLVRVFTADKDKNSYCVEFQRRKGDVKHFYELFKTARARIQEAHPCTEEQKQPETASAASSEPLDLQSLASGLEMPTLSHRSWTAPDLPSSTSTPTISKENLCETVRSLLQMCSSPCVDIKLQGVLALADLSCTPAFDAAVEHCTFNIHEVLVAEGCMQSFLDCLPIESLDLHRASLTALANLALTQPSLCQQVVCDAKTLTCLFPLSTSETTQVARECARFLSNCASNLGTKMVDSLPHAMKPHFTQTVNRLAEHEDENCRKHANEIQKAIQKEINVQ